MGIGDPPLRHDGKLWAFDPMRMAIGLGRLEGDARAAVMARQGVNYVTLEDQTVMDSETMQPVPADGETIGQLMLRGNTVMRGYLKNPKTTNETLSGGWLHTGDLAVMHEDGYIEIKDRAKDIIISGGENISSLEIEEVLYKHPKIMEAAVVARPDEKWGETPCAFVTPISGETMKRRLRPTARIWRILNARKQSFLANCPRLRPARLRNSCCRNRRGACNDR